MRFETRRSVRRIARFCGFVVATGLALTGCAPGEDPNEEQLSLIAERLVDAGYPGVIAARTDSEGTLHTATAGLGDLEDGTTVPANGEVRVGSATKTFTAVVILQLVEESRLDLEASVESLLPGIVRGEGIDASKITVRQLLQHTSGLPEYADSIAADPFAVKDTYRSARDTLEFALQ